MTTTYSYDSNTGEMLSTDYSDSTQDITFTYDRLGRKKTVSDAVGARTFAYNSSLQLDTETITGLYSKVLARDYETTGMIGRDKGFHIGTEYDVDYGYDTYGRFNSVSNGTDVFTYSYLTNSNLVSTLTMPNSITVNNSYETNRNLITSVENKYDTTTVSKYDYVNDAIGRRTSMAKSGTAFTQTDTISYGYNDRSEVTSATAANDTTYNFGFAFDNIGNRSTYTTNETGSAVTSAYTSNNLNQYTAITNPTNNPTYDNDGNMLSNGDWTYTWNGENRLIKAEKSDQKLEFSYDYMGRRVEKKVTETGGTTIWTVTKHEYFVYDGYKLIEKLNVLDSNAVTQKFVWSGETILSMTDANGTYYYLIDANKNVGQLLDSSGNIKAKYEYSPFGKLTSSSDNVDNPFRFSSEYFDSATELVSFNFRYYYPGIGRWLKRDDIGERGGENLYCMLNNDSINKIDSLGRLSWRDFFTLGRTETTAQTVVREISENVRMTKIPESWGDTTIFNHLMNRWTFGNGTRVQLSQNAMKKIFKRGVNPAAYENMKDNLKHKCSTQKSGSVSDYDYYTGGYVEAWYLGGHEVRLRLRMNCKTCKISGSFTIKDVFDFSEDGGWRLSDVGSRSVGVMLSGGVALVHNAKFVISGALTIRDPED